MKRLILSKLFFLTISTQNAIFFLLILCKTLTPLVQEAGLRVRLQPRDRRRPRVRHRQHQGLAEYSYKS